MKAAIALRYCIKLSRCFATILWNAILTMWCIEALASTLERTQQRVNAYSQCQMNLCTLCWVVRQIKRIFFKGFECFAVLQNLSICISGQLRYGLGITENQMRQGNKWNANWLTGFRWIWSSTHLMPPLQRFVVDGHLTFLPASLSFELPRRSWRPFLSIHPELFYAVLWFF